MDYSKIIVWVWSEELDPNQSPLEYQEVTLTSDDPIISELLLTGHELGPDANGAEDTGAIEVDTTTWARLGLEATVCY